MKNTNETLTLPDFEICLIAPNSDTLDPVTTTLPALQANGVGLVLYFYPKDNTQGCTTQALEFSELLSAFDQLGYQVLGVSRDGIKSHQNFIRKQNLQLGLISDPDERLCQYFDVIKEKMMYGKTHLGVVRSTFVFDKQGQLCASFRNIKAQGHASLLLQFLENL